MTRIQDDLYLAVNGEWIEQAEIPADKPATGGFMALVEQNEKILQEEFVPMKEGKASIPSELEEFVKYYRMASDFKTRDELGVTPLLESLEKIETLKDFKDFSAQLETFFLEGLPKPFSIFPSENYYNTDEYTLFFSSPGLILPDESYYQEEKKDEKEKLLGVFSEMMTKLFALAGKTQEEAQTLLEKAYAFDESLVPFVNTSEENHQIEKYYNPIQYAEMKKLWSNLPISDVLATLTGVEISDDTQVVRVEKRFCENFLNLVNEETFENIKAWMVVQNFLRFSNLLSEEYRQTATLYSRAISGATEARSQEKHSLDLASGQYSEVVGIYYGRKYFGEKAKADVKKMVEKMIQVYQTRLKENTWLTKPTIEKAIDKLDNLGVFIGYPDKAEEIYAKYIVDETKTLAENAMNFAKIARIKKWQEYPLPVNKERWHMPAHQVNAYFNPTANHIVFPAAILQAPFYSLEQSSSQNYGGIGAVIAHEISHAFDNNGSKFDKFGNLKDWWTDEDLAAFKVKQEEMIREFDGAETTAGKANGVLTVSENIADVGGINAAINAAKMEADVNLEEFWINWAKIWCKKERLEYAKTLLAIDVHAPAVLRTNLQAQNFEEFHETFNVQPGDKMYRAPEERVIIW